MLVSRAFLVFVCLALGVSPLAQAGNLKVVKGGSTLKVAGDSAGAIATFTSVANGDVDPTAGLVRVIPMAGTTVNGSASEATFTGVQNLSIKVGNGSNTLGFENVVVAGDLKAKGGKLNDTFSIEGGSFGDDVTLDGGSGANTLGCTAAEIGGDATYKGGAGSVDNLADFGCDAAGNLNMTLGTAHNVVTIADGAHAKAATLKTGSFFDQITMGEASFDADMKVSLGRGAGDLIFQGTTIGESLTVTAGFGADSVKFDPITVGGSATISLDDGSNIMLAGPNPSIIGESFSVNMGAGADKVNTHTVTVGGDYTVKLGEGANQATVDGCTIGGNFNLTAGKGDDHATITGNAVGGVTKINLGGGNNIGP